MVLASWGAFGVLLGIAFCGFCWLCLIAGSGYWRVLCGFPARLRALRVI